MGGLFEEILRIHTEPGEHYDDRRVHKLLTERPRNYLDFVGRELADIAAQRVEIDLPSKQIFPDPDRRGDFRVMPCIVRSPHGVRKTVKLVGTNAEQGVIRDQITVGRACALHPTDNFITHTFDACLLSSARTGMCAALAVQRLAPNRSTVAIIGAGRVGYYAALYIAALGDVRTFYIHDADQSRADAIVRALTEQPAVNGIELVAHRPADAVDVAILATISEEPVYGTEDFFAGTVVSLGADTEWQRELDPRLAQESDIYVDTLDSVLYGDLRQWVRDGLVSRTEVVDLLSLMAGACVKSSGSRRLFISTGSALFDNITIGYLLSRKGGDRPY